MLKNYFRIGWRNMRRNKAYATINIVGLSLGIASAILIFTLIRFHLSFDDFHHDKTQIYRITTEFHDDNIDRNAAVPAPLGKAFRNDYAFADVTARVVSYHNALISLPADKEIRKFQEEDMVAFVEPQFFDIFDLPLVRGNKNTALANPQSAIITEKIARKYFGDADPIGKTITFNTELHFTITGILKDIPANTDRKQEIYFSFEDLKKHDAWLASDNSWSGVYSGSQCFIRLKHGVQPATVNKTLRDFSLKYYGAKEAKSWWFVLQPLSDIHFNAEIDGYTDKKHIWALACIGIFLLLTACVNFVNLATAQSLSRSKEVGIRKVLGSLRMQLFWQFIAETTLITCFALILACGIAALALPGLNHLLNSRMSLGLLDSWQPAVFLTTLVILVIFIAGSYPGLVLARFKPVLALKSKISQTHIGGFSLRRVLVVTQFAISQALIIGTIVIAGQMHYSKNIDMGFDKQGIVTLPLPTDDLSKMKSLRDRISAIPGVEKISLCMQPPASSNNNTTGIKYEGRPEQEHWSINSKPADDKYLQTFGLQLVAGRNFFPSDTLREFIVNETAVKKLGIRRPQDIIGHKITINGGQTATVVGVVHDFHTYSLHEEIMATVIFSEYNRYASCSMKINLANTHTLLPQFEKIWNNTYPDYLYSYRFLDERIANFYEMDNIMLTLVIIFATIAIFIGSLGLYGLVSFMAARKTREIGVRKVLGANIGNILWLFGKEFTRLLLIAFCIAAPLAWWTMFRYLQDFKYRIRIGPGIFLLAILFTFLIAAVTVGYRSIRSALANPIKSLRTE